MFIHSLIDSHRYTKILYFFSKKINRTFLKPLHFSEFVELMLFYFMKLNDKIINETMMNAFIFLRREAITNG